MVKTRLVPFLSPDAAAELYRCMFLDTLAKATAIKDVALHLFYQGGVGAGHYFRGVGEGITVLPQAGNDLGERMQNAFLEAFGRGYRQVAIIGTDSPDLPAAYVEEAFAKLADEHVQAVFGPSLDGGYYLLGLKQLHGELFRNIAWSSSTVLGESLAAAERLGISAALLPPWYDVDTAADLLRPELLDPENGAPLTRSFLASRSLSLSGHFSTSSP